METAGNSRNRMAGYVIEQLWLIDSDGDGIYNMYSFDEDGILYDGSSDRFDHG